VCISGGRVRSGPATPLAHPNARIADRLAPRGTTRIGDFGEFLAGATEIKMRAAISPYFWVPAGCESGTPSGRPGPDAPPMPSRQGNIGWLFMANRGAELSLFEPDRTARVTEAPVADDGRSGRSEHHCLGPAGLQGSTKRTPRSMKCRMLRVATGAFRASAIPAI